MNITDVIALAKAGYKVNDIKELLAIELPKDEPTKDEPTKDEPTKDEPSKDEPTKDEQITELQSEIEKLKESLKNAQNSNINQNVKKEGIKTDDDNLIEFCKSFM